MDVLISRQAAIDALMNHEPTGTLAIINVIDKDAARAIIEDLPSAQPSFSRDQENDRPAEPCEDAVSRADVVDMLEMYPFTEYGEYETAREVVKRLPSVTPKEQEWIPCSSELPSDNREVEVTCEVRRCDSKKYRYTCHAIYVHKYTIELTDCSDWEGGEEYNEDKDKYYALPGWYERVHNPHDCLPITNFDFVMAWRELPEPYQEEGDE